MQTLYVLCFKFFLRINQILIYLEAKMTALRFYPIFVVQDLYLLCVNNMYQNSMRNRTINKYFDLNLSSMGRQKRK